LLAGGEDQARLGTLIYGIFWQRGPNVTAIRT
jgi:hypothetical protein